MRLAAPLHARGAAGPRAQLDPGQQLGVCLLHYDGIRHELLLCETIAAGYDPVAAVRALPAVQAAMASGRMVTIVEQQPAYMRLEPQWAQMAALVSGLGALMVDAAYKFQVEGLPPRVDTSYAGNKRWARTQAAPALAAKLDGAGRAPTR